MTLAKGAANQLRPRAEGGWGPPEHLPGTSLPPCLAVALGIFSQNPVSMAPPWGRSPQGVPEGMQASADLRMARGQAAPRSAHSVGGGLALPTPFLECRVAPGN